MLFTIDCIGIYLIYYYGSRVCYPNGSYFPTDHLKNSGPLFCDTNRTLVSGEVLLPNGSICNDTSRPIQCTNKEDTNGFAMQKLDDGSPTTFTNNKVGYKCCLPYSCDNDDTDIIIANI